MTESIVQASLTQFWFGYSAAVLILVFAWRLDVVTGAVTRSTSISILLPVRFAMRLLVSALILAGLLGVASSIGITLRTVPGSEIAFLVGATAGLWTGWDLFFRTRKPDP